MVGRGLYMGGRDVSTAGDTSGFKSKSNALIWINMEKAMADGIKF